jgi:ATP synthase protein I
MAGTDGRSEKAGGAASDAELARRLDRLSRELDTGKREREAAQPPQSKDGSGYAQATKMASEFIAGILVGVALGWGLDKVAGTSPWGLIGFLLLGFCAGVFNVVRASGRMTAGSADRTGGDGGSL